MATKNQVLKLIDSYAPLFIKQLRLGHCRIRWHVYHSESKEVNKNGFDSRNCAAQCLYDGNKKYNKTFDIAIYYDKQHGRKYTIGSIFHELLHVRFRQWDRLTDPKKARRIHIVEEGMVSDIEKIIIDLL